MSDTFYPYPAPFGLARSGTIPGQLGVEAVNVFGEQALLSDRSIVPVTWAGDSLGDDCGLDDRDLYSFVCGNDCVGWFTCFAEAFLWRQRPH
jgi:hypothetical protein